MTRYRLPWLGDDPQSPFPPVAGALRVPNGLLAAGGDLAPTRLLNAYRHGIFPWFMEGEPALWWAPDPRCVFHTHAMHVPRRLRRWLRHCAWRIESDRRYAQVLDACATGPREGGETWIIPTMRAAYLRMHELGHAHSIEVVAEERLVGGLYGIAIGHMFFAESMFSAADHGSKVALFALAHALRSWGWPLLDAQVASPHLFTLGAVAMPREAFMRACSPLLERRNALPWGERWTTLRATDL